ncbi:hypothetical protein N7470_006033 [Penicillium chermesinum]|nr:hypothetical protein N7470_006033 [Penicillium chermesinum]
MMGGGKGDSLPYEITADLAANSGLHEAIVADRSTGVGLSLYQKALERPIVPKNERPDQRDPQVTSLAEGGWGVDEKKDERGWSSDIITTDPPPSPPQS